MKERIIDAIGAIMFILLASSFLIFLGFLTWNNDVVNQRIKLEQSKNKMLNDSLQKETIRQIVREEISKSKNK